MAYSELIKKYEKIRDYMREFYVYGFRTRLDFDTKSARSYDNERRRVESWLSDYMSFRQDANGKQMFISVDSRSIPFNPLYKAYKAKSFTDKDIILHFYILDILMDGESLSAAEISERISTEYLSYFDTDILPDDSTIRNKLKEYASIGLLNTKKIGKEIMYSRTETDIENYHSVRMILAAFVRNVSDTVCYRRKNDMMICPESYVSEYENASFEELIEARDNLIEEIRALEKIAFDKDRNDEAWNVLPGPDVQYQVNLEYLSALCDFIREKYNSEIVWCDN